MTKLELIKNAKPILFNTDMVRAILSGHKTATRRVIKQPPTRKFVGWVIDGGKNQIGCAVFSNDEYNHTGAEYRKPKYEIGDVLYVRETWCKLHSLDGNDQIIDDTEKYYYAADNPAFLYNKFLHKDGTAKVYQTWKPSIHMPKEAARLFLRVTDIRVERLQSITGEDIENEGFEFKCPNEHIDYTPDPPEPCYISGNCYHYPKMYCDQECVWGYECWDNTIKKKDLKIYGWDANPWVWVVEFEKVNVDG